MSAGVIAPAEVALSRPDTATCRCAALESSVVLRELVDMIVFVVAALRLGFFRVDPSHL